MEKYRRQWKCVGVRFSLGSGGQGRLPGQRDIYGEPCTMSRSDSGRSRCGKTEGKGIQASDCWEGEIQRCV